MSFNIAILDCSYANLEEEANEEGYPYQRALYVGLYVFGIGATIFNSLEFASAVQCSGLMRNFKGTNFSGDVSATESDRYETDVFGAFNMFKSISIFAQVS